MIPGLTALSGTFAPELDSYPRYYHRQCDLNDRNNKRVRISSIIVWAIQLALIIHVLKTGRSRYWIFILIFMPLIGGIAYLLIEILPDFSSSLSGQRAARKVKKAFNPGAEVRQHKAAWEQSANTDNARRYAEALLDASKPEDAEAIVNQALKGIFAYEPTLLLTRARLQFAQNRPDEAAESLESLREHNPDFRSTDSDLLYARALEANGQIDKALVEYGAVSKHFPGIEARYRLALCLKTAGRQPESIAEMESILKDSKLAPAHFRKSQKPWLDAITRELATS